MSRSALLLAGMTLVLSVQASAQAAQDLVSEAASDPVAQALANAARLTSRRGDSQCRREAALAMARGDADIIVCAPVNDQALPVPEVYGPVAGSSDGAAVRPERIPCGLSLQDPCFEGIEVMAAVGFLADKVLDVFNPDRDLGTPTPIPERFIGANR